MRIHSARSGREGYTASIGCAEDRLTIIEATGVGNKEFLTIGSAAFAQRGKRQGGGTEGDSPVAACLSACSGLGSARQDHAWTAWFRVITLQRRGGRFSTRALPLGRLSHFCGD